MSCSTAYAVLTCMARSTRVFSKDKSHLLSAVPSCSLVTISCRHISNTTSFHGTKEGLPNTEPRGRVSWHAYRELPAASVSFCITWSRLKLAGFCLGGGAREQAAQFASY